MARIEMGRHAGNMRPGGLCQRIVQQPWLGNDRRDDAAPKLQSTLLAHAASRDRGPAPEVVPVKPTEVSEPELAAR